MSGSSRTLKKALLGQGKKSQASELSTQVLSMVHALNFLPILGDNLQKACFLLTVFSFNTDLFDKKHDHVRAVFHFFFFFMFSVTQMQP